MLRLESEKFEAYLLSIFEPMLPSTFPCSNHYLLQGLLPPYHGIIANKFYDPAFNATFRVGKKEFAEKRFWNGEPIWKTVENQV